MAEKLHAIYGYGPESLKPAQIQGWISSEKDRREKATILKLSGSAVALEESELLISHEVEEAYRKFWKEEPSSKIPGWKMEWRSRRGALWAKGAQGQQAEDEAVKQASAKKGAKRQQKGAKRQKKLRGGATRGCFSDLLPNMLKPAFPAKNNILQNHCSVDTIAKFK